MAALAIGKEGGFLRPTPVHIHIGPGSLGLGLIVWSGELAGFDVHLVSRPRAEDETLPTLKLKITGQEGQRFDHLVHSASSDFEHLDERTRQALADADDVLITTAVTTNGLSDFSPLLLEIASAARGHGAATTFVACENNRGDAYPDLEAKLSSLGVDCRICMVNRVCFQPKWWREAGSRVVAAHEPAEWMLDGQADSTALLMLESLEHVTFVPDVTPYELRKRSMINGVHTAAAISARKDGVPMLGESIDQAMLDGWVKTLHVAFANTLEAEHPILTGSEEYPARFVAAWAHGEPDDSTRRILSRYKRAELAPFIEDFERKFCEPVRAASAKHPEVLEVANEIFEALHHLLVRAENALDLEDLNSGIVKLSADADQAALAAYRKAMSGIVQDDEAEKRILLVKSAFARQAGDVRARVASAND